VHKKSQENFERVTYKRLIQIKDGHPETVELWLAFIKKHQFYGTGMKANVWAFEELGSYYLSQKNSGLHIHQLY
jgi:small subunit ribosomal protein S10